MKQFPLYMQVKWCNSMGEFSTFRGDDDDVVLLHVLILHEIIVF